MGALMLGTYRIDTDAFMWLHIFCLLSFLLSNAALSDMTYSVAR